MPSSTTELIKGKLDIVDFLRGYLTLQPAGRNFKALCPFHHEKTPSFMISPDRQSWHCFGCSLGGDIFTFIMRYENVEFGEAMRMLAEKAGVELRHENPAEYRYSGLLYDLNEQAKELLSQGACRGAGCKKISRRSRIDGGDHRNLRTRVGSQRAGRSFDVSSELRKCAAGSHPSGTFDQDRAGIDARPIPRAHHVPDP